jgi:hypothetical protein
VAELGVEGQAAFSFPARNTADRQRAAEELAR